MSIEKTDVLIIGAGLSGISAAYHLQKECPNKSFIMLEGRKQMGGTWDLFRYPGVRSDSDMFTLGYSFKPWKDKDEIAKGETIRHYIEETAKENNLNDKIRYQQKVLSSSWSSNDAEWTVEIEQADGSIKKIAAKFIKMCTGYYSYDAPFTPEFKGREDFKGQIIHPQFWPENLDYTDKNIVIIGSGATAVTLLPSLTDKAKHVTMLQRSPTFMATLPRTDKFSNLLRKFLPAMLAYRIIRTKKVINGALSFTISKTFPNFVKSVLLKGIKIQLGNWEENRKHFSPKYNPWDERICAVTDGDLFKAMKKGTASVVTDHIDTFTDNGIALKSGENLNADIIITATGLNLKVLGGIKFTIDNQPLDAAKCASYKGLMLNDVPNLSLTAGYSNASWTLKADLIHHYNCRLLNYMDKNGLDYCSPRLTDSSVELGPQTYLSSGYVKRSIHLLPRIGNKAPWVPYQNYILDWILLKVGPLNSDAMEFYKAGEFSETPLCFDD